MFLVVPLVGTWIEIYFNQIGHMGVAVVPLVGTWIEIGALSEKIIAWTSFPSWERGLKYLLLLLPQRLFRRSPRGNVD